MTKIGIHHHKKISRRSICPCDNGAGQAAFGTVTFDQPYPMRESESPNLVAGAVSRSVINKDDFAERDFGVLDLLNQWHDVVHFLQRRDNDRSKHGAGADDGIRTRDLRFTKPLLYQLSYVGAFCVGK